MALNKDWSNRLISDLMRDFDLTKEQAIGFVGSLAMESKGFTDWQEDKPVVKGSRGGGGMAQWTGPRRKAYEAHVKKSGYELDSYEAQYTYLRDELRGKGGHDGGIVKKLKKAKTVDQARDLTTKVFLRPGITNSSARKSWTNQVSASYKPVPGQNIPDVASELSTTRSNRFEYTKAGKPIDPRTGFLMESDHPDYATATGRPVPQSKTSKVAAVQLLNSMRGGDDPVITGNRTPKPLPAGAGDAARAKAANRDARSQPGFLSGILEEIGILPSMSSTVRPLDPKNPLGSPPSKKAPVEGLIQLRPGKASAAATTNQTAIQARESAKQPSGPQGRGGKRGAGDSKIGIQTGAYRLPTLADLEYKGAKPNVNREDEEFTRSVLNGYREIQHMGPSSKGAKAKPQVANSSRPSGATKTTAPSQDPIPRGVRPQIQVKGVDYNKRVTDPVSTRSHLTRNARAATVAATSLLKAGLVDPKVATTILNKDGVFVEGLRAPTPMDRIRGDKARKSASDRAPKPLDRPSSFNETRTAGSQQSVAKKSRGSSGSGSSSQSTPQGYTRVSSTSFVDESGGVYYDRHLK